MDEDKIKQNNKVAVLVSIVTILAICFCASYFVTDYINNKERDIANDSEENTSVTTQSKDYIKDSVIITLRTDGVIESEQTLSVIKKLNNIDEELTKANVIELVGKNGYKFIEMTEGTMLFERPKNFEILAGFEPNKYYIGEKDGYFAIYKSNANGDLTITSEDDIFKSNKKVEALPDMDQKRIRNFELMYDTKEEAILDITEFIS